MYLTNKEKISPPPTPDTHLKKHNFYIVLISSESILKNNLNM